jgi:polyamine oxidase
MPDLSEREFYSSIDWKPANPVDMLAEYYKCDYFTATYPDANTVKYIALNSYVDFSNEDLKLVDPKSGYRKVVQGMTDKLFSENDSVQRLFLNTVITRIEQNDSHVMAYTADDQVFIGEQAIVTFSLGVLQHKLVDFKPDLPEWKWESIFGFSFVSYAHIYFQFPEAFWNDVEFILLASSTRGYLPIWQNMN